jgi:hypothetical protein
VIAAVVGLYLGWRRKDFRIVIRIGASSALGLVMLAVWNHAVFGSWSLRGGYNGYVTENILSPANTTPFYKFANVLGFLAAPDRGLLVWTPAILLLLPFVPWRRLPDWVRGFLLAGIVYSAVQLQINSFRGGLGFYGYRLALELLVCMAPALVYAYRETTNRTRYVIGGVLGLQFAAVAIGASANRYWLDDEGIWTSNSYTVALFDHPWLYGLFTSACVLAALLITRVLLQGARNRQSVEA